MNQLSRDAQALLDRARTLHEPSEGDRDAVLRALASKLPAAAMAASTAAQAVSAAAGSVAATGATTALVTKWVVGGLLLGSLGVGSMTLVNRAETTATVTPRVASVTLASTPKRNQAAPKAEQTAEARAVLDLRDEPLPAPKTEISVPAPRVAPEARHVAETHAEATPKSAATFADATAQSAASNDLPAAAKPAASNTTTSSSDLLLEARALRDAQTALSEGRAEDALKLIKAQSARFGAGALQEERSAARLLALCALGRAQEAHAEIEQFLRTSARSPLAPRVRSACEAR